MVCVGKKMKPNLCRICKRGLIPLFIFASVTVQACLQCRDSIRDDFYFILVTICDQIRKPTVQDRPHMKRFVKCFFELLTQIIVKVRKCKVQRVCVLHFQLAGSGGCFFLMKLYH